MIYRKTPFKFVCISLIILCIFPSCNAIIKPIENHNNLPATFEIDTTPDKPVDFGYKMIWLAIKTGQPESVLKYLNLQNSQPCNWSSGINAVYNQHLYIFISPEIKGWVLVVSMSLPNLGSKINPGKWNALLDPLSVQFTDVQYYATHRVVEYHAWARILNGSLIRSYAYSGESGETLSNFGILTTEEKELGLLFFDEKSQESNDPGYWNRQDLRNPNEEDVMNLASKWSINPTELSNVSDTTSVGWIVKIDKDW